MAEVVHVQYLVRRRYSCNGDNQTRNYCYEQYHEKQTAYAQVSMITV